MRFVSCSCNGDSFSTSFSAWNVMLFQHSQISVPHFFLIVLLLFMSCTLPSWVSHSFSRFPPGFMSDGSTSCQHLSPSLGILFCVLLASCGAWHLVLLLTTSQACSYSPSRKTLCSSSLWTALNSFMDVLSSLQSYIL